MTASLQFGAIPDDAIPIELVAESALDGWLAGASTRAREWADRQQFRGRPGTFCWLPDDEGRPARVAAGSSGEVSLSSTISPVATALPSSAATPVITPPTCAATTASAFASS
jgi:hypothetical protein